ncbi:hypothetical protein N7513_010438 [Penicillium frequentans]|nr:hypothetical protein N7513_010438 [Penicillium glabrum]
MPNTQGHDMIVLLSFTPSSADHVMNFVALNDQILDCHEVMNIAATQASIIQPPSILSKQGVDCTTMTYKDATTCLGKDERGFSCGKV